MSDPILDLIEDYKPGLLDEIALKICEGDDCNLEEGEDGSLFIADTQNINALNRVFTGSFWADGVEYAFEAESGNNAGWVWRSVEPDTNIPEIKIEVTTWALAPKEETVRNAIAKGNEEFLLQKWDALLTREEIASIPRKYGYDKHFAPGTVTERYWKEKAAKFGFVLASREWSDQVRSNLRARIS